MMERKYNMFTAETLFEELKNYLYEKYGHVSVSVWSDYTNVTALRDGEFVLVAQDRGIVDFISRQYLGRIVDALEDITHEKLKVSILCGKSEEASWRAMRDDLTFGGYTFSRFIVGNSNKFAHAAALNVAKNPAGAYNPLLIYGGSGLGKTHLLYSIASEIRQNFPDHNIVYIKGDDFTNELVDAIGAGSVTEFRNKYRRADLLLVDDIQFIAGKERTQEEFFHTFNALHEAGKQIVLTADRPPKEMFTLEERLKTRFEWGLLADVQAPDLETRMALVRNKADALALLISDRIVEFIASSITNNVRQLEGVLKKIKAMSEIMGEAVDMKLAERATQDIMRESPGLYPTPELILKEVCAYFSITSERIIGLSKTRDVAQPRQILLYLIRDMTDMSLPEIGRFIKRDHTTVMYAINKVTEQIAADENLDYKIKDLKKTIRTAQY